MRYTIVEGWRCMSENKKYFMQQKKIILFLISLFIASSTWLFYASDRFINPNVGKNWWALSFVEPTSSNLTFTIENHSDQTVFHWKILENNQKIEEGDAKIEKGASQNVTPDESFSNGKFVIDVTTGQDKKEIYKNL